MKRIIIDYEKLTINILELMVKMYPDGYGYNDIVTFQNSEGKSVKAVEVKTADTIYLVKISKKLEQTMDDYMDDENLFDTDNFNEDKFLED